MTPTNDAFRIAFARTHREALDAHALAARQDHNFGNSGRWFQEFRGGFYGLYAREAGIARRYAELHAWTTSPRSPTDVNTALGELFFNADSALECLVYALNALGFGVERGGFRDTASESALKRVSPRDPIAGKVAGWQDVFPTFTSALAESWDETVQVVLDQHDVSKHRRFIHRGGRMRDDPPDGFWEALGLIDERATARFLFTPYAEMLLTPDPKRPRKAGESTPYEDAIRLEQLIPRYSELLDRLVLSALADAQATIPLRASPPVAGG